MPNAILLSDDLMFTSRIAGTARDLGLSLNSARSPTALLEAARRQPPTCVIVDLANDGLDLAVLMKELEELPNPPASSPMVRMWTPPRCKRHGRQVAPWFCRAANSWKSYRHLCPSGSRLPAQQITMGNKKGGPAWPASRRDQLPPTATTAGEADSS